MTRPAQPIRHGTRAGAQQHARRGVPLCEPCSEANAAYMRQYRDAKPDYARRDRAKTNARSRAATRLAKEYPQRFAELYDEELAKEET